MCLWKETLSAGTKHHTECTLLCFQEMLLKVQFAHRSVFRLVSEMSKMWSRNNVTLRVIKLRKKIKPDLDGWTCTCVSYTLFSSMFPLLCKAFLWQTCLLELFMGRWVEVDGGLVRGEGVWGETSVLHLNLTWLWPGTDAAISTRDQHQKERRSVKLV